MKLEAQGRASLQGRARHCAPRRCRAAARCSGSSCPAQAARRGAEPPPTAGVPGLSSAGTRLSPPPAPTPPTSAAPPDRRCPSGTCLCLLLPTRSASPSTADPSTPPG
eukprot:897787-Rhodomonas_salina.1